MTAKSQQARQNRMRKIVAAYQQYVATYSKQASYLDYMDKTLISDMLYGIGLAIDKDKFYGASGFDRFKDELRKYLPPNERLEGAAQALIDDVRRRYPGEALRCPYMIALDQALTGNTEAKTP